MEDQLEGLNISTQLQTLIQDESQAIIGYNNFLQQNALTLPANIIGKIREIIGDEKEHLESLNEMAKQFDNIEANLD